MPCEVVRAAAAAPRWPTQPSVSCSARAGTGALSGIPDAPDVPRLHAAGDRSRFRSCTPSAAVASWRSPPRQSGSAGGARFARARPRPCASPAGSSARPGACSGRRGTPGARGVPDQVPAAAGTLARRRTARPPSSTPPRGRLCSSSSRWGHERAAYGRCGRAPGHGGSGRGDPRRRWHRGGRCVAMCLASCVAETVMTGLLGGGHAIWWDGRAGRSSTASSSVPQAVGEMDDLPVQVRRGGRPVPHRSCLVWRPRCCRRARSLCTRLADACRGAPRRACPGARARRDELSARHAACLAMLEELMTLERGAELYAPEGRLLWLAEPSCVSPVSSRRSSASPRKGRGSVYRGSLAEALLAVDGRHAHVGRPGRVPGGVARAGARAVARHAGPHPRRALGRAADAGPAPDASRGARRPSASWRSSPRLPDADGPETHTTNLVAVDDAGRACVLTTSLGVGAGVWTPGFDLHLNSMLGETDLAVGGSSRGSGWSR